MKYVYDNAHIAKYKRTINFVIQSFLLVSIICLGLYTRILSSVYSRWFLLSTYVLFIFVCIGILVSSWSNIFTYTFVIGNKEYKELFGLVTNKWIVKGIFKKYFITLNFQGKELVSEVSKKGYYEFSNNSKVKAIIRTNNNDTELCAIAHNA